jgi:hypothetical protein
MNFNNIEWEIGDLFDADFDERMEIFHVSGIDKQGNEYIGSAYFFCGIFDSIRDIELELTKEEL